ncbi:MAG: uroporphyrinogen-III C-methyltransferase [Gammaproteobacteria bacterium]|uniref:uroporphyrinogen-III C-methyltransferase n=1 Tax=Candidatus Thiopontia autotrophica TaxID=2841688 RepID=A0A8J6PA32_9GAMM|nr:uroporphyrinogen-III C-methyltransferase [Candidatus Thiopontia autotrophica]MBL6969503.1 uroporphyrinogen-III C-methyltransferase [Gammaproteobacteria bacterium]
MNKSINREPVVSLIGAGPGDPDLLTIKALRRIEQAEVVVHDRLVSQEILDLIPQGVPRIYAGKSCGKHSMTQDEINQTLVNLAKNGRSVVRLKGGDPFIFGRGSEEALVLKREKIRFEIVPGITSGIAASAYAGIPVTHRSLSRGVLFVTGHFKNDEAVELDWRGMANPELTLVIYMGLHNLSMIADNLTRHGLSADTPVAVIENGTSREQRKAIATLHTIEDAVKREGLKSPALIVVGKVVKLSDELDWFGMVDEELNPSATTSLHG